MKRGARAAANTPVVPLSDFSPEAALAKLELAIGRSVDGLSNGEHLGLGIGPGSETGDARVYQPGQDDVRRIDWNVTARTDEIYVRDLIADNESSTWALVDATASMDFGTAAMEKRDLAAAVTVALAHVTARGGDQLGTMVLNAEGVQAFPHRAGRIHRLMVLKALAEAPRQAMGGVPPSLADGIAALERHRRRGLRLVVSDLQDPDREAWAKALRRLTTRQRVIVVEIIDPRELDLPSLGLMSFVDPESGATMDVDTSSKKIRKLYARAARAERAANAAAVRSAGADHLVLTTDGDWLLDLTRFVLGRRHGAPGKTSRLTPLEK